jgi:hypothetical protein
VSEEIRKEALLIIFDALHALLIGPDCAPVSKPNGQHVGGLLRKLVGEQVRNLNPLEKNSEIFVPSLCVHRRLFMHPHSIQAVNEVVTFLFVHKSTDTLYPFLIYLYRASKPCTSNKLTTYILNGRSISMPENK